MPHIVLEQINAVKDAYAVVTPFVIKEANGVLKINDKYLNASANSALIEALTIEGGQHQNFFIQLSSKENSLTVRLFPLTDPEKTPAVKKIMALVAKQIKDSRADIHYGKTNLQDYLID